MNKNQLEMAKLQIKAERYGATLSLVKSCVTNGCILGGVWMVVAGLKDITMSNPAGITAVAGLVKSLELSTWLGYIWGGVATGGYMLERKGKKRLLRTYAENRSAHEVSDPYRGSSGLNELGDSPDPQGET